MLRTMSSEDVHDERLAVVGFDPVVDEVFAGSCVDVLAVGKGDSRQHLHEEATNSAV